MNTDAPHPPNPRRKPSLRRRMTTVAALLTAAFVTVILAGCAFQERLIFPTHFASAPTVDPTPPTHRLWIPHNDRDITVFPQEPDGYHTEAWLEFAPEASPASPAPIVIYFHGNGEIIEKVPRQVWSMYLSRGVSVAMLEYRGYANSDGSPSQRAITRDARRLRDHLAQDPRVDPDRIIYHGRSLGGGVACQLAAHDPPAAMVLDSTFTSVAAIASRYLMPAFLVRHPFRSDKVLADSTWPVLISHGTADNIIPVSHAHKNHDATPNSTLHIYEGDGHNNMPRATTLYAQRLDDFLSCAGVLRTDRDEPADAP